MALRKKSLPPKRLVWRISEAAPLGEFVDPDLPAPTAKKERPAGAPGGWVMSSFELLHGTDISESPDTVPDELFDELFLPQTTPTKPAGER